MALKSKITIGSAVYIRGRASDTFQVIEEYEVPENKLNGFNKSSFFPHYICRCVITGNCLIVPLMHLSTVSIFSDTDGNKEFYGSRVQGVLDLKIND